MSEVTIYHNPGCSKSRQTLALLQERGIEPTIVRYLDNPPGAAAISRLLGQLGLPARALLRSREVPYMALGLDDPARTDTELIEAIAAHPILLERPIVVKDNRAVIGRPPENVLELL